MTTSLLARLWSGLKPRSAPDEPGEASLGMSRAVTDACDLMSEQSNEIASLRSRLAVMHRRAQKAEGEIARWPRIRVSHEREMDRWRERHYSRVRWMAEQINGARAQRNEAQREAEKLRDGIAYDTAKILDLEAQRNELRDEMLAYEGERDEARKRLTRVASLAAPWTTDNPPGAMDVLRSIVDICEGK